MSKPRPTSLVLFALCSLAAPLAAQQAADSVGVRPGDTLWGLAAQHLGSPYRWPAIREANADRVADPHWIYPRQWIRIPCVRPTTRDSAVEALPPSEPAATVDWNASGRSASTVTAPAPAKWPGLDTASRYLAAAAAPYLSERNELATAGSVLGSADLAGDGSPDRKDRFALNDRIILTAPRGEELGLASGVVIARRAVDARGRTVVVPTALVHIEQITGDVYVGRIDRQFGEVATGDRTLSISTISVSTMGGLYSGTGPARVVWIAGSAEQPTVGATLILGAGNADNVWGDDLFELLSDDRIVAGRRVPGTRIGLAKVMRVTAHSATAIVVSQEQPGIRVGLRARPIRNTELRPTNGAH